MKIPSGLNVFVDGDILRYRCGFAAERKVYILAFDDGTWGEVENKKAATESAAKYPGSLIYERTDLQPVENCLQMVRTQLAGISDSLQPSTVRIFLSGQGNFRDRIAVTKPYKAGRGPRPKHYDAIGEYLVRRHGAEVVDGREADDALGEHLSAEPKGGCIASNDKDLDQVSGWHHNFVTGESYWISPRTGDWNFYLQLLTGDATDNVPGIDGIGPAKASAILEGATSQAELCKRVWDVYRARIDDPERALQYFREQANLLWIQRRDKTTFRPPSGGGVSF